MKRSVTLSVYDANIVAVPVEDLDIQFPQHDYRALTQYGKRPLSQQR